jgi:hypothetical protein
MFRRGGLYIKNWVLARMGGIPRVGLAGGGKLLSVCVGAGGEVLGEPVDAVSG